MAFKGKRQPGQPTTAQSKPPPKQAGGSVPVGKGKSGGGVTPMMGKGKGKGKAGC